MGSNRNNFRDDSNKEKSKYRLVIYHKPEVALQYHTDPMVYYGFRTKRDGGLQKLMELMMKRAPKVKKMLLYNNQTGDLLVEWPEKSKTTSIEMLALALNSIKASIQHI